MMHALSLSMSALLGSTSTRALLSLDFQNSPSSSIEATPGWTFSRASSGYAETASGSLVAFGPGVPRITDKGLLVEESRTNLLTYSQQFDNAAWAKNNLSITADAITAPDGTQTADKLVESATTGVHYVNNVAAVSVSNGTVCTGSIFLKKAERTWALVLLEAGTGNFQGYYVNLSTGALGSQFAAGATATVTALANDWYRIAVTATANNTTAYIRAYPASGNGGNSYTGDGTSGIYVWGGQFELASFATSYIPTTTAAATRAADNASVTGLAGMLAAPVTLVSWADMPAADGVVRYLAQADADANNRFLLSREATNAANAFSVNGGSVTALGGLTGQTGARVLKMAARIRASAGLVSVGGTLGTSTALTAPATNRVGIGYNAATSANFLNGYIQRVQIFGDVDDNRLISLTV